MVNKADEMEMWINYKAMRLAYVFTAVFLLVWNIVALVQNAQISFLPFVLLLAQGIIFFGTKLFLSKKMDC